LFSIDFVKHDGRLFKVYQLSARWFG